MACTAKYLTLTYGGNSWKGRGFVFRDWDSGNLGSARSLGIAKPQVLLNISCKLLMDRRVNTLCIHDLGMQRGWTGRYKPQAAFPCSHAEVKGDTVVAGCCSGKGRWGPTCKKWVCFGTASLFTRASDGSSVHPAKRGQRMYKRAYSSLVTHCTLAQIVGGQLCTPCKQWQRRGQWIVSFTPSSAIFLAGAGLRLHLCQGSRDHHISSHVHAHPPSPKWSLSSD